MTGYAKSSSNEASKQAIEGRQICKALSSCNDNNGQVIKKNKGGVCKIRKQRTSFCCS